MKKHSSAPAVLSFTRGQRRYFYTTAALTGASIMIIEILGAKMLAPYFGTSHFVWTAQIAVTLVALAAGYAVGGWRVDRRPTLGWLYASLLAAAVYLVVAVWVVEPVSYWCLRGRLAVGSLLASGFLFFVPLSLLAMVCPCLVRMLTESTTTVGGSVGRLTAISTLGSFAGTILIGYVLIPFLPNSVTMVLTALGLAVVAGFHFLVWGPRARQKVAAWLVAGGVAAAGYPNFQVRLLASESLLELHRVNSNFGLLQVLESRPQSRRYYLNDYLTQNTYDIVAKKSASMFTYMLHDLARAYTPRIERVLCIGLGIGIVPMDFAREGAQVDVAEINPAVLPIARQYFGLEAERLNIAFGDGRYLLNQSRQQYDAVILDVFLGDSSPVHLMTREAFASMKRVLRPEGTLVLNCFGDFDPGRDFYVASLEKTLKSVFGSVRIHNWRNGGNVFFVASQTDLAIRHEPTFDHVLPVCRHEVETAFSRVLETDPNHGIVLTDNYNPLEYYDAANREEVRRTLADAMRRR